MTSDKLKEIIKQSSSENIRILIEVEPSGLIHIYCDKNNKRAVLRMIRSRKITCRIKWHITNQLMKYGKPQELRFLKENKGKIVRKF